MKKNRPAAPHLQSNIRWRRTGTVLSLLGALAAALPAGAQNQPQKQEPQKQEPEKQPQGLEPAQGRNQATLNFVGAEIDSVIRAVGHYTNTNFLIDPRIKGNISLVSERPVSRSQALQLLSSALRLQGFAMVRADGFTKVVPEAEAKLQPTPLRDGEVRGDQIATQIFRLQHESANNLLQVLRPLISPNNTINVNPGNNSLVITDYADNLRRLERIINRLDRSAVGDIDIVPVQHAIASDIAQMVNRLLDAGAAPAAGGEATRLTVMADPRTNSVIIRAPSEARADLARSLIARLDEPAAVPGNVHVVYLKNADAVRMAEMLRAVIAGEATAATPTGGQARQQQPGLQQAAANQQAQLGQGGLQQQSAPTALPAGGPAGFIQADPATNALIITANPTLYRNLRSVIDQLDARRAQVYIESLIVELTAERVAQLGVQWAGLSGDGGSDYRVGVISGFGQGGNNLINQVVSNAATGNPIAPENGLNMGIFRQINGQLTLGALARALESEANANILSMPNLITLDNEEARIIVGQNVPFVTGQFTSTASEGVNPFQTIERRDVGLELRVLPHVSEGGSVRMQIYQETSNVQETTNAADIITNKRSVETNVLVDDGQIIVLGGLIEDRVADGVEKVPGLGDIPVIGNLFKYQTRRGTKTNLMIFLRPTVIRTAAQSVFVSGDRYDYIRNLQIQSQPKEAVGLPRVQSLVLPPGVDERAVGAPLVLPPPRAAAEPARTGLPGEPPPGVMPLAPPAEAPPPGVLVAPLPAHVPPAPN